MLNEKRKALTEVPNNIPKKVAKAAPKRGLSLIYFKTLEERYPNESFFELELFSSQKPYKKDSYLNAFASPHSKTLEYHCQFKHKTEGYCGYIYKPLRYTKYNRNTALSSHLKRHGLADFTDDTIVKNIFCYHVRDFIQKSKTPKGPPKVGLFKTQEIDDKEH